MLNKLHFPRWRNVCWLTRNESCSIEWKLLRREKRWNRDSVLIIFMILLSVWLSVHLFFFSIHLPTILLVCICICMCATHYNDVIISTMASPITSLTDVYSTIHSGTDERKHQSSASLALVRGIYWWPVNLLAKKASNMENVSIWWGHHAYHFSDDL